MPRRVASERPSTVQGRLVALADVVLDRAGDAEAGGADALAPPHAPLQLLARVRQELRRRCRPANGVTPRDRCARTAAAERPRARPRTARSGCSCRRCHLPGRSWGFALIGKEPAVSGAFVFGGGHILARLGCGLGTGGVNDGDPRRDRAGHRGRRQGRSGGGRDAGDVDQTAGGAGHRIDAGQPPRLSGNAVHHPRHRRIHRRRHPAGRDHPPAQLERHSRWSRSCRGKGSSRASRWTTAPSGWPVPPESS